MTQTLVLTAYLVLTLALGNGATTEIFSVVYGVLMKPLPFHEPERLVSLQQIAPHGAGANHGPGTYLTYRENQQVFEAIGAWDPTEVSITGGGDPERVPGYLRQRLRVDEILVAQERLELAHVHLGHQDMFEALQ